MAINSKQRKLIAEELKQKRRWYFLSYSSDTEFLGAVIVRAHGPVTAERRAKELDARPDTGPGIGGVISMALGWRDMQRIPANLRNRLLTEAEVLDRLEGTRI